MRPAKAILLVIGVLFVSALIGGCALIVGASLLFAESDLVNTFDSSEFATYDDWPGGPGFEEQFELDFPPSSRDIKLASDGFQDPIYQFRMTVDPDEVPLVASSIGCNGLLSQPASEPPRSIINNDLDWWQPEAATVYQECSGGDTPGREQMVFVDLSDPEAALLYVLVFYF